MPIYMKLTSGKGGSTIVGEARDAAHRGWIALDSFSWGNGRIVRARQRPA